MREAGGVTALAARPAPLPAAAARHRAAVPPAADPARLQLREALAGLAIPDLQQQCVFAAEALLTGADAAFCDWAAREALRTAELGAAPTTARRLRYRLAARALAARPSGADWGGLLVAVRDRLVERCSAEDHAPAAAQLAALAQQLAASCIDAYCRGCYASLGFSAATSKADLPRDWLSQLLLQPLLRVACRGPARTLVANACLLAHAVLRELGGGRWAKSAGVLHAAVDCLKHALKLTGSGALPLCAGEALLPLQACVSLLGPRLKLAALEGILTICTRAMQRSEWAVRKAAADTLAQLAETLLGAGGSDAPSAAGQQQQGLTALEALASDMAAAVEQHLKYDRIPQCTHHIEHPQFSLRLQAAPPEAQLCLAAAAMQQAAVTVHSVRFWSGSDGADVGLEFGLACDLGSAPVQHRYWLNQGQLLQEHQEAPQQGRLAAGQRQDAGRLQRLQEQLAVNMQQQIQRRLDEHEGRSPGSPHSPASGAWGPAEAAESVGGFQDAEGPGSGSSGVVLAVSNPLFGSSRPGTAEGLQSMQDALLPPKRSLRRQRSSQDESSSPRLDGQRQQPQQQQQQKQPAGLMRTSFSSLGSGFGVLHRESEAEVQQFLRGSLAVPRQQQQQQQQQLAAAPPAAKLLQTAVGRMPGNPGESADAAAIQEALMDVLSGWTLHVQKHYQRAAAEQLAAARRQHGGDAAAVQREGRRLEAAREAAVRDELSLFVEQTLPRLAEVLSSRELLLRCIEAAADQDDEEIRACNPLASAPERRRSMQAAVATAARPALAAVPHAQQRRAACVLCHGPAAVYCRNDDAFLCTVCDVQMHSASAAVAAHERCAAAALPAPACAPSDSAVASTLPTPTAQQLRHAASLETLGDPMQSMRSVLQPPVPSTGTASAAPTQLQAAQLQAAHQQLLLQRAYPSYGPAVSLRPPSAALANAQVSPFCFYSQRPLAAPPPLPAAPAPAAEAAPARWGAAGGSAAGAALARARQSAEDLTRWEGRAPATAAHASSLDEELMECLAGLNSDPSSVLECAPLDLSRPLPLNPMEAVALGSGAAAAAEGGRASPASDGSGDSANLDQALAATMSVASSGSRPSSAPESPSGLTPPGQSGVWLHYPPSQEARTQVLVRDAAPHAPLVVVPQPAVVRTAAAERDALAMAADELGRQAQLVTTGGQLLSQAKSALAAVITSGGPAGEQAALLHRQLGGDGRGAAAAATPRSASAEAGRSFSPLAIRVTVHRGSPTAGAAPKRPASAAPDGSGPLSPKRARSGEHRHRPSAAEAAVAALAAACGGQAAPLPPCSPRAAAAAAKLAKAERWAAKAIAGPQEGSPRKRARSAKRPRAPAPQLTAEQIAAIVIPPYREDETRADKLARYRAKKLRRSFQKKVRYECRKHYADVRPRIKGRFVSPEEFAAWQEAQASGRADSEATF
ncbi:Zinc finger CONSTANS-LIKE 5 isoform A [Chlorella sorokiniana]|uniref:Zinc finger CONSTANS-LIKE 5 isoform A n=1 Tax=Chlorella sorokiniana TaxID=3076 RepID=A0A2P6U2I2_CHLSO|nr:Zinc finger CONSTANS-LIKE 5 isoform A [Chlorella sorokiniana]|eukprot:PRW60522.1 Zinc finger CONSTANS-LIKE 5 isoform A [Chlorella sorokiniana]